MAEVTTLRGVIHGQTVTLNHPVDFADGEAVQITIAPLSPVTKETLVPGDGLRKSAGAWADDADALDEYLEWNRQRRKQTRTEAQP